MASIERALMIAAKAHEGRFDRQGTPYILHPLRVMHRVTAPEARIVAILHDVVEDSDVTLEDLRREGFSQTILDAVERVTHSPDQSYAEYVLACRADHLATQVKLADLEENMSPARLLLREDKLETDLARYRRYALSYQVLTDKINEQEYLRRMKEIGS